MVLLHPGLQHRCAVVQVECVLTFSVVRITLDVSRIDTPYVEISDEGFA